MIDFYRLDGTAVFARPMEARWASSPEPTQFAQNGVVHASVLQMLRYRDIHIRRRETLDVAIKVGDEANCFGFTNTSYASPGWKDPHWLIPQGRYRIKVSIYSGSEAATKTFTLRNDWPRPDFCLQSRA